MGLKHCLLGARSLSDAYEDPPIEALEISHSLEELEQESER